MTNTSTNSIDVVCASAPTAPVAGLTAADIAEVAREAVANERSVIKRIVGLTVRGAVGHRIDAALAARRAARAPSAGTR